MLDIDKRNIALFIKRVKQLQEKCSHIYIYGTGLYGRRVYKIFKENSITIKGIVVTSGEQYNKDFFEEEILVIDNVSLENTGIVIGAGRYNSIEIQKILKKRNCSGDRIVCACEYLDDRKIDEDYFAMPTIDITTVVGCKINCKYCPQELLINRYFFNNPRRDSVMKMETFMMCLEHLPEKCSLMFCGMAEPFLNPLCGDMICKAIESRKKVDIYTTLVGATQKEIEKIWDLPIDFVNIHVADNNQYAHISVTEEYLNLLSEVLAHKRKDGTSFVSMCNAQGEPHPYVKQICGEKFDMSTALHDRAGNLSDDGLLRKNGLSGMLSCSQCGQKLNHNILLPDGTLLLCAMDYGMKHTIGNLKEDTYTEIMEGDRIKEIKAGLMGNEEIDILCRNCSFANEVKEIE